MQCILVVQVQNIFQVLKFTMKFATYQGLYNHLYSFI